ncbi:MAG: OmpA family protein, partial [Myxococcota bacterium]
MYLLSTQLAVAADAASIDTELVRPTFAAGAIPGFDAPGVLRGGAFRAGVLVQYERDPLVLHEFDAPVGAVVRDRFATVLGATVDFNERFAARLTLPVVSQWGSEVPALAGDGLGTGDVGAGVRFEALDKGALALAARADFAVPTGTRGAWVAEEGVRFSPGAVAALSLGRLGLLADAGVTLRRAVPTADTLTVGTELTANLGADMEILPDRLDAFAGALGRFGLGAGPTGTAMELLAGARLHALPELDVDLAGGRGLLRGYGGTEYRVLASVTFHRAPALPEPEPERASLPPEASDALLDTTAIEEEEFELRPSAAMLDVPLARVEQTQIVIRDPIQFERNTDKILPASLPTLGFVAKLMNEHPDIAELVIEGHASGEGDFAYNYELSVARALAVFRALVEAGVHPSRLACRGWGEVAPAVAGEGDAALAANRRVVFHIAHRLPPGEVASWSTALTLPWNGEARTLPAPPA